jgi:quercetin dioxygenase-like cupin family protein
MTAGAAAGAPHSHVAIDDIAAAVTIQAGAVVSKVVFRDEIANVTVFGFGAGEELTEHRTARPAVVQVLSGRLLFTANGEELDAEPGFWLYMPSGTPHSLVAVEPTVMLLTLLRPSSNPAGPAGEARPGERR